MDLYPGFCHGFLECKTLQTAEKLVKNLEENFDEEKCKLKDNFKNIEKISVNDQELFKRSVELDFIDKKRTVFFLSTQLNREDMNCGSKKSNSIPNSTKDFGQFEKIGLFVIENVMDEDEEKSIAKNLWKGEWENLSHRRV